MSNFRNFTVDYFSSSEVLEEYYKKHDWEPLNFKMPVDESSVHHDNFLVQTTLQPYDLPVCKVHYFSDLGIQASEMKNVYGFDSFDLVNPSDFESVTNNCENEIRDGTTVYGIDESKDLNDIDLESYLSRICNKSSDDKSEKLEKMKCEYEDLNQQALYVVNDSCYESNINKAIVIEDTIQKVTRAVNEEQCNPSIHNNSVACENLHLQISNLVNGPYHESNIKKPILNVDPIQQLLSVVNEELCNQSYSNYSDITEDLNQHSTNVVNEPCHESNINKPILNVDPIQQLLSVVNEELYNEFHSNHPDTTEDLNQHPTNVVNEPYHESNINKPILNVDPIQQLLSVVNEELYNEFHSNHPDTTEDLNQHPTNEVNVLYHESKLNNPILNLQQMPNNEVPKDDGQSSSWYPTTPEINAIISELCDFNKLNNHSDWPQLETDHRNPKMTEADFPFDLAYLEEFDTLKRTQPTDSDNSLNLQNNGKPLAPVYSQDVLDCAKQLYTQIQRRAFLSKNQNMDFPLSSLKEKLEDTWAMLPMEEQEVYIHEVKVMLSSKDTEERQCQRDGDESKRCQKYMATPDADTVVQSYAALPTDPKAPIRATDHSTADRCGIKRQTEEIHPPNSNTLSPFNSILTITGRSKATTGSSYYNSRDKRADNHESEDMHPRTGRPPQSFNSYTALDDASTSDHSNEDIRVVQRQLESGQPPQINKRFNKAPTRATASKCITRRRPVKRSLSPVEVPKDTPKRRRRTKADVEALRASLPPEIERRNMKSTPFKKRKTIG